jgi:hypothetical protein
MNAEHSILGYLSAIDPYPTTRSVATLEMGIEFEVLGIRN